MPSDKRNELDGSGQSSSSTERHESCDYPQCDGTFDPTAGIDHWFEATEFDTDGFDERQYCSRECLINDQVRVCNQ